MMQEQQLHPNLAKTELWVFQPADLTILFDVLKNPALSVPLRHPAAGTTTAITHSNYTALLGFKVFKGLKY